MSYPLIHTINKERKRSKKKERLLLLLNSKPDISILVETGHFYFGLTNNAKNLENI